MTVSRHTLISVSTRRGWSGNEVATALISLYGRYTPRNYDIYPHEDCPEGEGYIFASMEEWSNDSHCTACDFYHYSSIGD